MSTTRYGLENNVVASMRLLVYLSAVVSHSESPSFLETGLCTYSGRRK